MALKPGVVKDILCVVAYGTAPARASAAKLLFYYWPSFNPNLFDRRAVLVKFASASFFDNFESNSLESRFNSTRIRRWLGAVRVSKGLLSERGQRRGGQSVLRSSHIHHLRLRDTATHVPLHRVRQRDSQISSQSNVLRYFAPHATSVNDMREQGESSISKISFRPFNLDWNRKREIFFLFANLFVFDFLKISFGQQILRSSFYKAWNNTLCLDFFISN